MKTKILTIFMLLSTEVLAFGNSSGGGGGEYVTFEHNPWFVGDRGFTFCVEESDASTFSLSFNIAQGLIADALLDWRDTIRDLNLPLSQMSYGANSQNCNENFDLIFYLGKINDKILKALPQIEEGKTVAYSKMTSFDKFSGRAKGFIWIAPDQGPYAYRGPNPLASSFWSSNTIGFHNVVLHELGHVFGFQHQNSGVMRAEVPAEEVATPPNSKYWSRSFVLQQWTNLPLSNDVCGPIHASPQDLTILNDSKDGLKTSDELYGCLTGLGPPRNAPLLVIGNPKSRIKERIVLPLHVTDTDTQDLLTPVTGFYWSNENEHWPMPRTFLSATVNILRGFFKLREHEYAFDLETTPKNIRLRFFDVNRRRTGHLDLEIPTRMTQATPIAWP